MSDTSSNPFGPSPDSAQADTPPGSGLGLRPQAGAASFAQAVPQLAMSHDIARQQFNITQKGMNQYVLLKRELTSLAQMGDMVTADDVVNSAGKLVAAGFDPRKMATLLADMPEGGQALSAWLGKTAAQATINHAKLSQTHEGFRHNLGIEAMKSLGAQHIAGPDPSIPLAAGGNA